MLSSPQKHSHINWAISAVVTVCFLFSLGQKVKICLRSLRFAAPAGSNKPQTCFLGSKSTFAALSLRQRPYHYPHKQQKNPLQCQCWRYSFSRLLSAAPIKHLCTWGGALNAQKSHRKSMLVVNVLRIVLLPEHKNNVRIYLKLTDKSKLLESVYVVRNPVV